MAEIFTLRLELSLWSIFIHRAPSNFLYERAGVWEIASKDAREDEGSDNEVDGTAVGSEEDSMTGT